MPPALDASHPVFALPPERSRAYLRWTQRLAQAEGIILLIGSGLTAVGGRTAAGSATAGVGIVALALLSLTLGWQVARGSPRAAVILLGLSVSRSLAALAPGAAEWWTSPLPLTLLELFVFAQGVRGAIALAQHHASADPFAGSAAAVELMTPGMARVLGEATAAGADRWSRLERYLESRLARLRQWPRSAPIDIAVAVVIGWFSVRGMTTPIPRGEGLIGLAEVLTCLFSAVNFLVSVTLLVAARGTLKAKTWATGLRVCAYVLLAASVWVYSGMFGPSIPGY